MQLPPELIRYFADSRLQVESFAEKDDELILRIEKEIGPETGLIRFRGVSFLAMSTNFPGVAMRSAPLTTASQLFWDRFSLPRDSFENDDMLFEIEDLDGITHFVVAKNLEYRVLT